MQTPKKIPKITLSDFGSLANAFALIQNSSKVDKFQEIDLGIWIRFTFRDRLRSVVQVLFLGIACE